MGEGGHSHAAVRTTQRRALWGALVANGLFLVVEVVGGLVFNSLALLADAAHMLTDVVGLGIALLAQRLLDRPASAKHSYGLLRAEVLGAQANGVTLVVASVWIVVEAIRRLDDPPEVVGAGLIAVASVGLVVNVVSAIVLARARHGSLNMQGAFVHMAADTAGSAAAVVAGIAVLVWQAHIVDPIVSVLVASLVLWSAWRLLRDTAHVLLEGTPRGLVPAEVEAAITAVDGVAGAHHLHLWNLASDVPALSAHVVLAQSPTLTAAQERGEDVKAMLATRFGIEHATLELEGDPCSEATGPAH